MLPGLVILVLAAPAGARDRPGPCFDFTTSVVEPLRPPIPMVPGRDNAAVGTYPSGAHWASARARLDMPIAAAYAKLLDHRNHKDMKKTALATTDMQRPGYLHFQRVDVVVTVRAWPGPPNPLSSTSSPVWRSSPSSARM